MKIDNVIIPLQNTVATHMYLYNKPVGEIVAYKSHTNPKIPTLSYTTIFNTINTKYKHIVHNKRLIYCGRLDLATTGLLVLTTVPRVATLLTNTNIPRIYHVIATPIQNTAVMNNYSGYSNTGIPQHMCERMKQYGITIDHIQYKPLTITLTNTIKHELHYTVELIEGKNREIRRIFEYFNMHIKSLQRIQYGDYMLPKSLQVGGLIEVPISSLTQQLIDTKKSSNQPQQKLQNNELPKSQRKQYIAQTT